MPNQLKTCRINHINVGQQQPLVLFAGPCALESETVVMRTAEQLKKITEKLDIPWVFKVSFDKANRTSVDSFRGLGIDQGMAILDKVKNSFGCPVMTDVHEVWQVEVIANVVDVIQIPAFLCRQTDLLLAAGKSGRAVNVKKGQFMAASDMIHVINKLRHAGCEDIMLCERGTSFGYHNLVVDMRSIAMMSDLGLPVVFDATHAVQMPGGGDGRSSGRREFVFPLAKSAVAMGLAGLFMETHPDPEQALSDGPNMIALKDLPSMLQWIKELDQCTKAWQSNYECSTA